MQLGLLWKDFGGMPSTVDPFLEDKLNVAVALVMTIFFKNAEGHCEHGYIPGTTSNMSLRCFLSLYRS